MNRYTQIFMGYQPSIQYQKKECMANYVVRYESFAYQCLYIEQAIDILTLLRKQATYKEHLEKMQMIRQKKIAERQVASLQSA